LNYVWCEDSKSGYQFWKEIFETIYPEFNVDSKYNNTRLRKEVSRISEDGNVYYIIIDMATDNPDVLRENIALQKIVEEKKNVYIIKINSFEFALLSFEFFEKWVFAEDDYLKQDRSILLNERDFFVRLIKDGGSAEELDTLKTLLEKYKKTNTEQLAATLLYGITRNTGFETDKSKVGPCFIIDCCNWKDKQSDDICGLSDVSMTAKQKKNELVEKSVLKKAFKEVGL